jgi:general secretion pathway protein C
VAGRTVSLGPRGAPAEVQLELPALPEAATGTLPTGALPARPSPGAAAPGRGQVRQSTPEGPPQEPPQQEPLAGQEPPDPPSAPR